MEFLNVTSNSSERLIHDGIINNINNIDDDTNRRNDNIYDTFQNTSTNNGTSEVNNKKFESN